MTPYGIGPLMAKLLIWSGTTAIAALSMAAAAEFGTAAGVAAFVGFTVGGLVTLGWIAARIDRGANGGASPC